MVNAMVKCLGPSHRKKLIGLFKRNSSPTVTVKYTNTLIISLLLYKPKNVFYGESVVWRIENMTAYHG